MIGLIMHVSCLVRYRYSKDDEEIYKEFMEIANELIPHLVKTAGLSPKDYNEVLRDPECFAAILRWGTLDSCKSWQFLIHARLWPMQIL